MQSGISLRSNRNRCRLPATLTRSQRSCELANGLSRKRPVRDARTVEQPEPRRRRRGQSGALAKRIVASRTEGILGTGRAVARLSGLTRACKCKEGCIKERVRDLRAGQSKRANPPLAPMLEREKLCWPSLANGNKPTLQGEGARFGKGGAANENCKTKLQTARSVKVVCEFIAEHNGSRSHRCNARMGWGSAATTTPGIAAGPSANQHRLSDASEPRHNVYLVP